MARITLKELQRDFRLDIETAKAVRELADAIPRHTKLRQVEASMDAINKLIDGFGVEAMFGGPMGVRDAMYDPDEELLCLYVNMGDTYNATILWDARRDSVSLTTWGDFVERLPKKYQGPDY